jgi:hypothetical protein
MRIPYLLRKLMKIHSPANIPGTENEAELSFAIANDSFDALRVYKMTMLSQRLKQTMILLLTTRATLKLMHQMIYSLPIQRLVRRNLAGEGHTNCKKSSSQRG